MSTSKALEIAEFEGYHLYYHENDMINIWYQKGFNPIVRKETLELLYSSFNGLMEIVFRVNREDRKWHFSFDCDYIYLFSGGDYEFPINNNEIEALQDAILFYHKNK